MCGITAVINKSHISAQYLAQATSIVAHRGPDDEGFLLWNTEQGIHRFSGQDTNLTSISSHQLIPLAAEQTSWTVGLAHRRLSILDLSPAGHQPMLEDQRFAITYNGEVFNYLEIKEELQKLDYVFSTTTDTEVILKAWKEWGPQSLHRFNGMFAFVLLDTKDQKLYVVRDRFGVKPVYYTSTGGYLAVASEVKQLRELPHYQFTLNKQVAYDYLRYGMLDHTQETFEQDIVQLAPGHYMEIDLSTDESVIHQWYILNPLKWQGTEEQAITQFAELVKDSIRLRMRSDVPIGAALSGGLDSSTIVGLMKQILIEQKKEEYIIKTVTSCNEDKQYDEWPFADECIKHVHAEAHKTFPSFEKLTKDMASLIWHMDYPFNSTSQFSQWCVFEEAQRNKLPVMMNGQGADEQLAGYGGNDMSLYIGLLGKGSFLELVKEIKGYREYHGHWPVGFLVGAIQHKLPKAIMNFLPERYRVFKQESSLWLHMKGMEKRFLWPNSLKESLTRQVTKDPLPSLLRYEDRNSMAFSIEARVPFMDHRLIEFTLGLPENLVYRKGERKYILREAFKGIVPEKILKRRDKMGFVSAEERWLKEEGKTWFEEMIRQAGRDYPDLVHEKAALNYLYEMQSGKRGFDFDPWRIICFSSWLKMISQSKVNNFSESSRT